MFEQARQFVSRRHRAVVIIGLLLAVAARIALSNISPIRGDASRFLAQATSLSRGAEQTFNTQPATALPPGYPLFVRFVFAFVPSIRFLLFVQFLLSVSSCWLVYLAVRPRNPVGSVVALYAMAMNPWLARQPAVVMSEVLGVFLVSLLLFLVTSFDDGRGPMISLLVGATAVAIVLTSTAASFLALAIWLWTVWTRRRRRHELTLLLAGSLLLAIPWQIYVVSTTGRIEPLMLHYSSAGGSGLHRWIRSWVVWPGDMFSVWVKGIRCEQLPPDAVANAAETQLICDADAQRGVSVFGYRTGTDYDQKYQQVAEAHIRANPLRFYVWLPVVRSATMWLDFGTLPHANVQVVRRVVLGEELPWSNERPGATGVTMSCLVALLNLGYCALFAFLAFGAVRRCRPLGLAIVFGVLVFTGVSASGAYSESRRNTVFYPALLFLVRESTTTVAARDPASDP